MNILLVNDDGYNAIGIKVLEEKLKSYGDVYVVAPYEHMSGKSVSLTIFSSMEFIKFDDRHYALKGTPADCVCFGLTCLGIKFDVTISGINDGLNITYDILHSGTIGACIESLMYGVPSIAFSQEKNLDFIKDYIDDTLKFILDNKLLSKDYLLNVNFPIINRIKGIKFCKVVNRNDYRYFEVNGNIITPKRTIDSHLNYDKDSDVYLVNDGYIAISVLNKDFHFDNLYLNVKSKVNL